MNRYFFIHSGTQMVRIGGAKDLVVLRLIDD